MKNSNEPLECLLFLDLVVAIVLTFLCGSGWGVLLFALGGAVSAVWITYEWASNREIKKEKMPSTNMIDGEAIRRVCEKKSRSIIKRK